MKQTIVIKRSSVAGRIPSELQAGELAVNLVDKLLYTADTSGNIITLNAAASPGNSALKVASGSGTTTEVITMNEGTADKTLTVTGDGTYLTGAVSGSAGAPTVTISHADPTADPSSEITAAISGSAGEYAKDTEYTVLTGVKAQRDAKGHITGLTYSAQKVKDTNTEYTKGSSSDLNTGTDQTGKIWDAKTISDFVGESMANATRFRGGFNAGTGAIDGGETTLTSVAEKIGDVYVATTAGTFVGTAMEVGDSIIFKKSCSAGTAPTSAHIIFVEGTVSVDNKDATLAWSTATTVATVEGTNITVSLPANPNTDTSVTSVNNHYTPSGGTTKSASGATGTSGTTVQVVTGVTCDAAGHVTSVTSGAATDTTYESKTAASGGTDESLVTTGEKYTWNNKSDLTLGNTATTALAGNTTYAGSSTQGGAAMSAEKLTNTSKIGDTNQPVYFTASGVPTAISYTIDKSVPSNAVFTDTTYTKGTSSDLVTGTDQTGKVWDAKTISDYVGSMVTNATHFKGGFNASTGAIDGGSSTMTSVAEKLGDVYTATTAGTFAGTAMEVGDSVIFKADCAAGTAPTSSYVIFVEGTVSVEDKGATLAWSTSTTVATVEGTNINVSLPANPNTDTSVTSVSNHYTPTGTTTKSASGASGTSGSTVQVVTGVTCDAAGHVTAVTSGAATDSSVTSVSNHYTPTGTTTKSASGASGTSGSTVQVVTGVTVDAAGHVTAVTSGAATDTTYSKGSTSDLITGTNQTGKVWDAKTIHDYVGPQAALLVFSNSIISVPTNQSHVTQADFDLDITIGLYNPSQDITITDVDIYEASPTYVTWINSLNAFSESGITVSSPTVNAPSSATVSGSNVSLVNINGVYVVPSTLRIHIPSGTTLTDKGIEVEAVGVDASGREYSGAGGLFLNGEVDLSGTISSIESSITSLNNRTPSTTGTQGQFLAADSSGKPSWVANPNTDTKVTSVSNHYTPTGTTTKSASGASGTSGTTVQVVTGVTCDAAGHVTAVTSGAATDTTYESKTAASGGTDVSLVTTGEKYTWNNKSNLALGNTASTALAGNTKYAGASTQGGAATSAEKLTNTSKIGDTNSPVYFTASGVPTAISYTIDKSVPSNAVFTDNSVTSVSNHYTPSGGTTKSASGASGTSGATVQVVTGVTCDAAGHVTGVTSGAATDTNTTYSFSSGTSSTGNGTFTVTPSGGSAQTVTVYNTQPKVGALGSTTQPVYTSSSGTFATCSTYAGGTAVTLNGTSKAATTASFYAPTDAGSNGMTLVSNSAGIPVWTVPTEVVTRFTINYVSNNTIIAVSVPNGNWTPRGESNPAFSEELQADVSVYFTYTYSYLTQPTAKKVYLIGTAKNRFSSGVYTTPIWTDNAVSFPSVSGTVDTSVGIYALPSRIYSGSGPSSINNIFCDFFDQTSVNCTTYPIMIKRNSSSTDSYTSLTVVVRSIYGALVEKYDSSTSSHYSNFPSTTPADYTL